MAIEIIKESTIKSIQSIGNIQVNFKEFDERMKKNWEIINNAKKKHGIN